MLTQDLNIQNKPIDRPPKWSALHLLSFSNSLNKIVSFFSPLEFILFIMILISGVAELLDRTPSWFWYLILFLVLLFAISSRAKKEDKNNNGTHPLPTN